MEEKRKLWVIERFWSGVQDETRPTGLSEIITDQHRIVVNNKLSEIAVAISDCPNWRVVSEPADGQWVNKGSNVVYIYGGKVVTETEFLEATELTPQQFGGESWEDVNMQDVWQYFGVY